MSKDDLPLRVETTEDDERLIAEMGTNSEAWAQGLHKVMPMGVNIKTATAWFHHAIEAGRKSAKLMPLPQQMEIARKDGGWVLGLVQPDGPTPGDWQPWVPVTWGDSGWYDDDGNGREPVVWVPLPDPQPKNTGWTPPSGVIRIVELSGDGWTCNGKPIEVPWRWMIEVQKPDGTHDAYRDSDMAVTLAEAETRALKWQAKLGLEIVQVPIESQPSSSTSPASNVVPLRKGDTLQ